MNEVIENFWFENERIYIRTNEANVYSRPLGVFPILCNATPEQREEGRIVLRGEALRWDNIDEDIHISSFYKKDEPVENEIMIIFSSLPQLNIKQFAQSIGINYTLLSSYINGSKKPSKQRIQFIKDGLRNLGRELLAI
ncbi:MAG: DUF2442 domain-containing protein [Muribaculaceae bacterium]|nr:DUF2442 domain-containing protein [Muribaculaceae bacterium]